MRRNGPAWILFWALLAGAGCSSPSQHAPETGAAPGSPPPGGETGSPGASPARTDAPMGHVVLLSTQTPTRKEPIHASLRDGVTHAEIPAVAWRWYVNGETAPVSDPVLPVSSFRRGDEVIAEAVAGQGSGTAVPSQRVRVRNAPPVVTSVTIDPTVPKKGEVLSATAAASDLDDDPVRILYRWRVNGKLVQEDDRNRYSLADAKKGDQVHCEAVPDDGTAKGVWAASPIVEVVNSPPRILTLPPARAASGAPYLYPLRAEDPDGDSIRIEIVSGPPGMVLDGETVVWAPAADVSGIQRAVLRVTDDAGGEARQEFSLVVSK